VTIGIGSFVAFGTSGAFGRIGTFGTSISFCIFFLFVWDGIPAVAAARLA
jgi:hypothetical protein